MSDLLERAAAELIARPPREARPVHELRRRVNRRRGRRSAFLGVVVIALVVAGLVAIARRSTDTAVGDPIGELDAGAGIDNDGTVPCGDFGCGQFDPIAVAPGVDDFYIGPASLGDPLVSGQFWDAALRCVQLDAGATTCTKIEGLMGVPLVTYDGQVEVGTTFGSGMSIADYAQIISGSLTGDNPPITSTSVRGHAAVSFSANTTLPALMWEERPGVIVWVTVSPSRQAELPSLAEGVVLQSGPASIPGRLVVPNTGPTWTADDNSGSSLVIAKFQGAECVGWGFIDKCKKGIDDRTFTNRVGDSTIVAGSVPPEVVRVRIHPQFREPIDVVPFSHAGYTSRYYSASLPQDFAGSVEWLDATGIVLSTTHGVDADVQAGIAGLRIAQVQVADKAVQLSADVGPAGASTDGSSTVIRYIGTAVPTQPLLCTYIALFGPSATTCSSPTQLNLWDSFDGMVFGAAGTDVTSVLVDGQAVELHTSADIKDRRFFVAAGSKVVFLDSGGKEITVPPPIDRQQNP